MRRNALSQSSIKQICSIAIAIMLVLFMVTSCQRPLPEPITTPAPVETPAPSPKVEANKPKGADETDRSGYNIIAYDREKDGELATQDIYVMGEVYVDPMLSTAVEDHLGDVVHFYVQIQINPPSPVFYYKGHTVEYYKNVPIMKRYNDAFEKWKKEEFDGKIEHTTADSASSIFYEIWEETASEYDKAEYNKANEELLLAMDAMGKWKGSDEYRGMLQQLRDTERERLKEKGLDIIEGELYRAYLTPEQILSFPCTDNYGYQIYWA